MTVNGSSLSERRDHEGDIPSQRQSFKSEKRTINYAVDDDKSDSGTEYDKVVVLGSQIASKRKKEDFQKERKSNQHKNKSKSQEVIDIYISSK